MQDKILTKEEIKKMNITQLLKVLQALIDVDIDWGEVLGKGATYLIGFLITGLGALITWLINKYVKNEKLKSTLTSLTDTATTSALQVYQTYVEALKKAGTFDEEAQAEALKLALEKFKEIATDEILAYIEKNYEGEEESDNFIITLIEAALAKFKSNNVNYVSGNTTTDTTTTEEVEEIETTETEGEVEEEEVVEEATTEETEVEETKEEVVEETAETEETEEVEEDEVWDELDGETENEEVVDLENEEVATEATFSDEDAESDASVAGVVENATKVDPDLVEKSTVDTISKVDSDLVKESTENVAMSSTGTVEDLEAKIKALEAELATATAAKATTLNTQTITPTTTKVETTTTSTGMTPESDEEVERG